MAGIKEFIKEYPIEDIQEHKENPRVHPDSAIDKLSRSIETFGFINPVIISTEGVLLAGHARKKASVKNGLEHVPALIVDLNGMDAEAYLVADNRLAEETEWDRFMLKEKLDEIDLSDFNTDVLGFDSEEIEDLMNDFYDDSEEVREDDFDVDESLDNNKDPVSESGDVWQLGRHRLMVGDSTKEDEIMELVNFEDVDMVFTDPPYNVDYEGSDGKKIQNDSMETSEFYQFLLDAYQAMYKVMKPGSPLYVCHADSEGVRFRTAFEDAGFLMKQCIVWVKNSLVLGRQDYQWKHEPILYGWKPGAAHKWHGGRKQTTVIEDATDLSISKQDDETFLTFNSGSRSVVVKVPSYEIVYEGTEEESTVWRFDKPKRNGEHPTMKPITICAKAIKNSSKLGELVLDPFGGSGSTLIAAEQTGRKCCTMEFDPVYADVIIERWEKFTGQKAVKINAKQGEAI